MKDLELAPLEIRGCGAAGCLQPRYLRREIKGQARGTLGYAVYLRNIHGQWRVVLGVDEDAQFLIVLERSPWKGTRTKAKRWLDYRTTVRVPAKADEPQVRP